MSSALTTQAVILARGLGTRMRRQEEGESAGGVTEAQHEVAETGVKAMIPIDRPFLDYVLSGLADAGIEDVCLVIGPEHDQVRDYYQRQAVPTRLRVHFAEQAEPRGTADAVAAAESFAGGRGFILLNSDNYYPLEALRGLARLDEPGVAVFGRESMIREANLPAERIHQFAVVQTHKEGYLRRIIEKPDESTVASLGEAPHVSMNCWRFSPLIFEACRRISPSPRGELELTDAVQTAMDEMGERFRVVRYDRGVLDLSSRADVAGVAERLRGVEVRL